MIPKINGADLAHETYTFPKRYSVERSQRTKIFIERMTRAGYAVCDGADTVTLQKADLPMQAYRLEIRSEGILLAAGDDAGFYYGFVTLFQLIAEGNGRLPCGSYSDSPRFSYRGVMLDVCRHFFGVDEVKKIIDQMSLLKLNKFHWHLSNDQGYRVESKRFPRLNEISSYRRLDELDPLVERGAYRAGDPYGGFYTQEEIREVVDYAKERFIEVIPEIEMPGHGTAILAAYPELTCGGGPLTVASTFGIYDRIFCAGKEMTYEFLCRLLDEICSLFESDFIHIGGDEAPKSEWKHCPDCSKIMRLNGYDNYERLQSHFTNKIVAHLKTLGKTPIVWNESAIDGELDDAAVIQYWMEMAPGESYIPKEFGRGRKLILSNQCPFYCDYSYAETPLRATLLYEPQVKDVPVPLFNVLGIEAPLWTEWLTENADVERMLYPRLLAVAECGWTQKRDTEDFSNRAQAYLKISAQNILSSMPWADATISGEEALETIARKTAELSVRHGKMAAKQGKTAQAVVHDGAPTVDPQTAARAYMKSKMTAYSEKDVDRVLELLSEGMQKP